MGTNCKDRKQPKVIDIGSVDDLIVSVVSSPRKQTSTTLLGSKRPDEQPLKHPTKREKPLSSKTDSTSPMFMEYFGTKRTKKTFGTPR